MPTLDEIRDWMLGAAVPGLPPNPRVRVAGGPCPSCGLMPDVGHAEGCEDGREEPTPSMESELGEDGRRVPVKAGLDVAKMKGAKSPPGGDKRYTISMDGRDATFKFGKYNGQSVSDLARDGAGREYLKWVLKEGFPAELKDVIKIHVK